MRHLDWIFPLHVAVGAALTVFVAGACSSGGSGTQPGGGAGFQGSGGSGSPFGGAAGSGGVGAGPSFGGSGGAIGAGGVIVQSGGSGGAGGGGAGGAGGGNATGGSAGGGGAGSGGTPGMGGSANGGVSNSGGAAGAGGASGTSGSSSDGAAGAPPSLEKFCGNITQDGQVPSNFITYWNQITPENEGKWGSVEAVQDQMNWSGLDRVHDFAKQHNIPFKQHNFVWGSQQPSWISGLSQADQSAQVEEWIRLFCERYPDTQLIDVVNEPPPHTTPPYIAALGGAGASGYDWIVQAFKWARQYCPTSILIMNDYNTIEYANDNSHFIDIVNAIKAAGAPIDAMGAQAHAAYSMSTSTVQMYLDKLASSTGLPVYISEYDINLADDNQQLSVMQSQFSMFWNDSNVKGVTLWGYIVGETWETNTGLMTTGGTMRPAMSWLMQYLMRP